MSKGGRGRRTKEQRLIAKFQRAERGREVRGAWDNLIKLADGLKKVSETDTKPKRK